MNIVQPPVSLATFKADSMPTLADRTITLTKHKASGPAPYVGRPFRYGWYCATDHLGRAVAGESFRVYEDGSIER